MQARDRAELARRPEDSPPFVASWGQLRWIFDGESAEGAEMTVGRVTILPGQHNPEHAHPNCEEMLVVLSGECSHRIGGDDIVLRPGSVIRIPRGVRHYARCISSEPLEALVVFSSACRQTVNYEGGDLA